jgi:hypothetical protein
MNFFQRRKLLKRANYLELTPVRVAQHETAPDGEVIIVVPKFKREFWREFVLSRKRLPNYRIRLDELGAATWLEVDGIKKVGEICSVLSVKLGEKIHPAEERVTKYLTILYDQRYISFRELGL